MGVETRPLAARMRPAKKKFLVCLRRNVCISLRAYLQNCRGTALASALLNRVFIPSRLDRTGVRSSGWHAEFGQEPLRQNHVGDDRDDYPSAFRHGSPFCYFNVQPPGLQVIDVK